MKKIVIIHLTKDIELIGIFLELGMGVNRDEIYCTCIEGDNLDR